jgi:SAM-dependent methyltransferase
VATVVSLLPTSIGRYILVEHTAADERWLAAAWLFVREHLPAPPARVLELGCGPLGGFVPRMRALGFDAIGVDPEGPAGSAYRQTEFERYRVTEPVHALLACTSLHHVADLDLVLDQINAALAPGGTVVVIEWAHERFDEATARWCFDRLDPGGPEGWLQQHRDRWRASGQPWDQYFQEWARNEQLHAGRDIMHRLRARFDTQALNDGPYLFADLGHVTSIEEQAAIAAGLIQPTGLRYVGSRRARSATPIE